MTQTPDLSNFIKDGALSPEGAKIFQETIWAFYAANRRDFAWRKTTDPYEIVVSEIMLQQTQTDRVTKKFENWTEQFPTFADLAEAPWRDVLVAWQGLGYNRRAQALHEIAKIVVRDHGGTLPADPEILKTFPGIGPATAASICAFAFNMPTIFIETNIRTVYIALLCANQAEIADRQLMPWIAATCDKEHPREWYYALMDYGVFLKKLLKNPSRRSRHHTAQSRFEGSERQIRGMILKVLSEKPETTLDELCTLIDREPERIRKNLVALCAEGLVRESSRGIITL